MELDFVAATPLGTRRPRSAPDHSAPPHLTLLLAALGAVAAT
jgi:hypothetical protein